MDLIDEQRSDILLKSFFWSGVFITSIVSDIDGAIQIDGGLPYLAWYSGVVQELLVVSYQPR